MSDNKLLTRKDFASNCEFEHMYSDQEYCMKCYSDNPDYCPLITQAFKDYIKSVASNEALFIMMGGDDNINYNTL